MELREFTNLYLFILLLNICLNSGNAQAPEVDILKGRVQGITMLTQQNRNISGFLGIPYAQPPIGDLRFNAPVEVDAWDTTLITSADGNVCLQTFNNVVAEDEDCLYLNVYTPQLPENENSILFPVMVWIHGGGFMGGSSVSSTYGPRYLLDQDVVLVAFNYRLGPFGFLSTGDEVAPGNWGMKDMVLALKWVQDNIIYFGGDPDQVTIFGESAGATAVHLLTLSNSTIGLFHKYITQSGSALSQWGYVPRATIKDRSLQLAEYLGCTSSTSDIMITCLRQLNSLDILNTTSIFLSWNRYPIMVWTPTDEPDVEGAFLTDTPENLLIAGKIRDLPWMAGVTRDEGVSFGAGVFDNSDMLNEVLDNFDVIIPSILGTPYLYDNLLHYTDALKSYYFSDLTADVSILSSNFTDLLSDALFFYPAYKALQYQFGIMRNPQYFYSFEYRGTYSFGDIIFGVDYGVLHGDDLLYLFPEESEISSGEYKIIDETDLEMIDIMVQLWTSFAINGTPAAANSSTTWDPYSSLNNHLRIGNESDAVLAAEYTFYDARMHFWSTLSTKESVDQSTTNPSSAKALLANVCLIVATVYVRNIMT